MPFMLILRKGTTELPCNTLIITFLKCTNCCYLLWSEQSGEVPDLDNPRHRARHCTGDTHSLLSFMRISMSLPIIVSFM